MASQDATPRVFISSTMEDLRSYREAVKEALLKNQYQPIDMHYFNARPVSGLKTSLDELERADVLIGIYAWRYGSIPEGSQVSFIEQEFDHACKKGIPCLCFKVAENFDWPMDRDTGGKAARLDTFKKKVSEQLTVRPFTTRESLVIEVLTSLHEHFKGSNLDPNRRKLAELLETVERRSTSSLARKVASQPIVIELEWHRRLNGRGAEPEMAGIPQLEVQLFEGFREYNRILLLGEPGAGRSVALLGLACELAARIPRPPDPPPPIPIHLALTSWRPKYRNLEDWLASRLNTDYSRHPKDARNWSRTDALLPLLDGLDELEEDYRPACVAAVKRYLEKHGGGLVISSQPVKEKELAEQLQVQAVVLLKPLSETQREAYLATAGPGLETLHRAFRVEPAFRELASSPLMLRLMVKAYKDAPSAALDPVIESIPKDRPRRVVEAYVAKMEEPLASERGEPSRTNRALAWLAWQMDRQGMTRFEIERLQPSWLASAPECWTYALVSRGLAGGFMGAVLVLAFWDLPWDLPWFFVFCGLAAGATVGAIDALPLWRSPASGRVRDNLPQAVLRVLILGVAAFAVSFGVSAYFPGPSLVVGLVFGLVFGSRPGDLRGDTRILEIAGWHWSWEGGGWGLAIGAFVGLVLGSLIWLLGGSNIPSFLLLVLLPGSTVIGGLVGATAGGLEGSFEEAPERPNLGVRRFAWNTLRVGLSLAAPFAVVSLLVSQSWLGAYIGLATGLLIALWYGGLDILQHFVLRVLISATGPVPWRWVRFLDHAANHGLLNKIEGREVAGDKRESGYEFPHRIVQDYFVSLWRKKKA